MTQPQLDLPDQSSDVSSEAVARIVASGKRRSLRSVPISTLIAGSFLAVLALIAILAPVVWPHVATQQSGDILQANRGPSGAHVLGTDTVGRDVLLRLMVGARLTLIGVLEGLVVVAIIGVPLGVAAGYLQGRVDKTVNWLADILFSIPAIVVIIAVLAVFRGSMLAAMTTFGVLASAGLIRVVRASTLQVREELYISAAQVAGLSSPYILTRHVLPRLRGVLAVQLSLLAGFAILVQTGLAFLGLLVAPPAPSWGSMVAEGTQVLAQNAWLIWPSGAVIAVTVLAFGVVSDSIRTRTIAPAAMKRRRRARAQMSASAHEPQARGTSVAQGDRTELLRVRNLRISADGLSGETRIVDASTFSIGYGETVGLVGESGCGKSVTSAALIGVLPSNLYVAGGSIEFEGTDLTQLSARALRTIHGRQIGFVGQEPMGGLNPSMSVGAQLGELVRQHHRCRPAEAKRRVQDLLASVRLPDPNKVARKYPHELSGGMAQRVAIARALAGEPKLLIADEPTTALDVTVQAEILALLRETTQQRDMSVLLITHDWGVVAAVCDRAVVMYAGQVIEAAPVEGLLTRSRHPYTGLLLASDPHRSRGVEILPTIPGSVPPPGSWPKGCRFAARCPHVESDCRAADVDVTHLGGDTVVRCIHPMAGVSP